MSRRGPDATIPSLALKAAAAAAALGMSREHFDRNVKDHVPVIYSGSIRLYPTSGLQEWVERNAVHPGRRPA